MTTPQLPIALYVDKRRHRALVGEQTALHFWLVNRDSLGIEAVSLELRAMGAAGLDSIPYERVGHLAPGEARAFSMTCIPRLPGIHVVTLSVQIRSDNDLSSSYELKDELHIVVSRSLDAQVGMTVEVQGAAIVDGPLPPNVRHLIIKGDAILDNLGGITAKEADSKDSDVRVANMPPAEKDVAEVKLQTTFDGLSPLDFKVLERAWKQAGRKSVHTFRFVNDRTEPMGTTAKLCTLDPRDDHTACDHYRLKVMAHRRGYVTLLLRGTGKRFMVAHPTTHAAPAEVGAMQAAYFPAGPESAVALLPLPLPLPEMEDMDVLCFTGTGLEQALVLITSQPLISNAGPLIAGQGDDLALQYKEPNHIKAAIQLAAAQHDSELGYAEIEVVER